MDAENPGIENWIDFIPETENVLDASAGSGYIFAHYMIDAISKVKQYDKTGRACQGDYPARNRNHIRFHAKKDDK